MELTFQGVYKEPPRELDDVKEEQGGPPFERSRETWRTVCPRLLSGECSPSVCPQADLHTLLCSGTVPTAWSRHQTAAV